MRASGAISVAKGPVEACDDLAARRRIRDGDDHRHAARKLLGSDHADAAELGPGTLVVGDRADAVAMMGDEHPPETAGSVECDPVHSRQHSVDASDEKAGALGG